MARRGGTPMTLSSRADRLADQKRPSKEQQSEQIAADTEKFLKKNKIRKFDRRGKEITQ